MLAAMPLPHSLNPSSLVKLARKLRTVLAAMAVRDRLGPTSLAKIL
jgi:hypothetical protein